MHLQRRTLLMAAITIRFTLIRNISAMLPAVALYIYLSHPLRSSNLAEALPVYSLHILACLMSTLTQNDGESCSTQVCKSSHIHIQTIKGPADILVICLLHAYSPCYNFEGCVHDAGGYSYCRRWVVWSCNCSCVAPCEAGSGHQGLFMMHWQFCRPSLGY
jgi:hypothetical protein